MPVLVVNHSCQTRLKPRLHPREPLASSRTGVSPPPVGADRNPPRARVDSRPPPAKVERPQHPSKVKRHPLPAGAVSQPPQVGANPPQPQEVLPTFPQVEEEQATVLGLTGSKCTWVRPRVGYLNPQHLRTQLGWWKRGERREAVGHIYDRVAGKEPPKHNITSRALRAYYTRVDPQTLSTWACQILCMIAEYHMACMTRGSAVTSPILPRELAERLPPLADYAPPESCI